MPYIYKISNDINKKFILGKQQKQLKIDGKNTSIVPYIEKTKISYCTML